MSNWFIVEGENDWDFLHTLINHRNVQTKNNYSPIQVGHEDHEAMGGSDLDKLKNALNALTEAIGEGRIKHIGIVLDNDGKAETQIKNINEAVREIFGKSLNFKKSGDSGEVDVLDDFDDVQGVVKISCFLVGINDRGELETVLKEIASKPSPNADCLEKWYECITHVQKTDGKGKGREMRLKWFEKRWVRHYTEFDTHNVKTSIKKENDDESFLTRAITRKLKIWNFEHKCLSDLYDFLDTFSQS